MFRFCVLVVLGSLVAFGSTLELATSSNPSRLNPLLATDSSSSQIADFLFNGLVKFDKDNKEIVGDLAKNYHFESPTTLVFELKKGVLWHDGVEFSSKDVVFTYNLLHSKNVISPYAASFRFVKSVKALGRYKVEVTYKQPYFKALETWMMGILPYHILKDETNLMSSAFNTHPIGTGAYKLKRLEFSKTIELEAFENYFEPKAKIKSISFHVIPDPSTRFLMLQSQQLDIGSVDPMVYEKQLKKSFFQHFNIYEKMSNSYTYLGFNLRKKKFQNPKVREALSLAIDRQELIDILFFSHAQICKEPALPGTLAYNDAIKTPTQDRAKAKQLLAEAGYDEDHPFEFEIATSNSNAIRPYAAEILQYQLAKVGVKVHLRIMEWQAFLNTVVFPHKFDTVLLGWGLSATPDPYMFWHSASDKQGGFNLVGYHNKEVDAMIERSQTIVERKKLAQLYKKLYATIVAQNPYLFLYIPNAITAVDKNIKHIQPALSGIWHNYTEWEKTTYK